MGTIASHEAQPPATSKSRPGEYGAFGLLAAYFLVLAVGMFENFSIEKFEATMNIVAIAGFSIPFAVFWRTSRPQLRPAIARDPRVKPKEAGSMKRWGSRR